MNFVSLRIITADIERLVRFYEQVTGIAVTMYTEGFGELATPACTLGGGWPSGTSPTRSAATGW